MSSASDMLKWLKFNLDGGKTETGEELLTGTMFDEAIKATMVETRRALEKPEFPVPDSAIGYGYGWLVGNYRGFSKLWHSGGFYSYTSYLWIIPNANLGLFRVVNGPDAASGVETLKTTFYYMADILLGETPWLNKTTSCTFPAPWRKPNFRDFEDNQIPRGPLDPITSCRQSNIETVTDDAHSASSNLETNAAEYTGIYSNPMFTDITVTELVDSEPYTLYFIFGRISGDLRPTSDIDVFLLKVTDPVDIATQFSQWGVAYEIGVVFTRNQDQIISMALKFEADMKFDKMA